MNLKQLKTCLRYPGGKSRATKFLLPRFPKEISEYRECFLGGGSVAIAFTKENPDVPVWVNDLYWPLYNFWVNLQQNGYDLQERLLELKNVNLNPDSAKDLFLTSKDIINSSDKSLFEKAVAFYVVNKCSFSGLTESSSFSRQASINNFSINGISKLSDYSNLIKNWKITNLSYEEMVYTPSQINCFWFLDPPYDIKDNLYGNKGSMHKGFDHKKFHSVVTQNIKDNWMITYNDNETLSEWYSDYNCVSWDLTYTMRSTGQYASEQKQRRELLVTNYEIRTEALSE